MPSPHPMRSASRSRAIEAGYRYTTDRLRDLPEGVLSSLALAPEGRGRIP